MSSTGRGAQRHPDDFYETPAWAVDALATVLPEHWQQMRILEPAAGRGAIVRRLIERGAAPARIAAAEIDEERAAECQTLCATHHGDFLATAPPAEDQRVELVVMNPPFSLAQEFVERCHLHIDPKGHVGTIAVLLRLAFLASAKRREFRAKHPFDLYPLASRPSFTGGGTDSADYAWYLFGTGHGGRFQVLETAKSEPRGRKAETQRSITP